MVRLRVREWRRRRALSMRELAEQAGIALSTLQKLEGAYPPATPHPRTIRKVAAALGVEPHELERAPGDGADDRDEEEHR